MNPEYVAAITISLIALTCAAITAVFADAGKIHIDVRAITDITGHLAATLLIAAIVTAFGGSVPTAVVVAVIAAIAITWLRWPERRDPARARRLAENGKVFGDFDAAALRRGAIEDLDGAIAPNAPNEGDGHPGAYVPEKQS